MTDTTQADHEDISHDALTHRASWTSAFERLEMTSNGNGDYWRHKKVALLRFLDWFGRWRDPIVEQKALHDAAPDMLAALKSSVEPQEKHIRNTRQAVEEYRGSAFEHVLKASLREAEQAIAATKAAIAKAEPQAQGEG